MARATIPVKVSRVVTDDNAGEISSSLDRCVAVGIRRIVLRKPLGDATDRVDLAGLSLRGDFRGCPVFDWKGAELTYWDFDDARMSSLNLFADGTLGTSYLLAQTPEVARR